MIVYYWNKLRDYIMSWIYNPLEEQLTKCVEIVFWDPKSKIH